jgi:hypothetical protein
MDAVDRAWRGALDRGDWPGHTGLRVLGYSGTVRWVDPGWQQPASRRLELISVPHDRVAAGESFSLVTAEPGTEFPYALFVGEKRLISARDRLTVLDYLVWYVQGDATRADTGHVIVHAGAVVAPDGGAVLLPAASGSGKSTLVIGLLARGYRLLSDEYALIAVDGSVTAFPRALGVKPGSYAVVAGLTRAVPPDDPDDELWHLRPEDFGSCFSVDAHTVVAVVAPKYLPGSALVAEPMTGARVVERLAGNLVNRSAHGGAALQPLARVARGSVGAFLSYGSLPAAVEWIVAATAPGTAPLAVRA